MRRPRPAALEGTLSITTPESQAAAPDLDPEIRRFLETMAADAAHYPAPDTLPFDEARRILEGIRAPWTSGGPRMAATTDHEIATRSGPVRLRFHQPRQSGARPALVYLHGGGWTYFSLDTHDRLMREYAARSGVAVVGVDYALSPENRYPTALHQLIDTLLWLKENGREFGVEGNRLAVGGDSAGANLAIAAGLALRDAGKPDAVSALVLNYGAFDAECSREAEQRYGGEGYMLGAEEMRRFWANYVRDPSDFDDPLVCPLRAALAGLPPVFFAIPECDLLSEQNHLMAEALRSAGVEVEAREYPGTTHSFLEAMSVAAVSRQALADTAGWLRRQLQGGPNATDIDPDAKAGPSLHGDSE